MAELVTDGADLVVRLSRWERLASFHGDVRVPLTSVRSVSVEPEPWSALRGLRAPGTGLPGVVAIGTFRFLGGKDFAVVRGRRPVVRVELDGSAPYRRLLVLVADPAATAARLQ